MALSLGFVDDEVRLALDAGCGGFAVLAVFDAREADVALLLLLEEVAWHAFETDLGEEVQTLDALLVET